MYTVLSKNCPTGVFSGVFVWEKLRFERSKFAWEVKNWNLYVRRFLKQSTQNTNRQQTAALTSIADTSTSGCCLLAVDILSKLFFRKHNSSITSSLTNTPCFQLTSKLPFFITQYYKKPAKHEISCLAGLNLKPILFSYQCVLLYSSSLSIASKNISVVTL